MYHARSISLESVKKGSRGGKYKKQKITHKVEKHRESLQYSFNTHSF